jgi:hypothetical protein
MNPANLDMIEPQIGEWRAFLQRRQGFAGADITELENHLREQVADLCDTGLQQDEAFLIAVKRMGNLDALSSEFAREHSGRLWKQLVLSSAQPEAASQGARNEVAIVVTLAVAAALSFKLPELFGLSFNGGDATIFLRNASFFALPFVTAYFLWKRGWSTGLLWLAPAFAVATIFVNAYPFQPYAHTEALSALHLPIVLWLVTGVAYAGGEWRSAPRRMDFIRFSGELFIYYVLIALGGGVLTGVTFAIFNIIGVDVEPFVEDWLLPCGAIGALVVAAWLVEAKQSVIENMAPVLTRIFSPLFALMLAAFIVAMFATGEGIQMQRDILIAFNLLLVLVLGLLLYAVSARQSDAKPDAFDMVQLALIASALLVDILALLAIASRISEFGLTPNRIAALGLNLVLLVNLGCSAWLYVRFLRGSASFAALERWQTAYLPVYGLWAAFVVIVLPPAFGFI